MHLVLSPVCILIIKRDLRKAAKDIYMKRSTQPEERDITIKELTEKLRSMGDVRILFTNVFIMVRFNKRDT